MLLLAAFAAGSVLAQGHEVLDISVHGKLLAILDSSVSASLWNLQTGRKLRTYRFAGAKKYENSPVESLQFSRDGKTLFGCTSSPDFGYSPVWNVATGREIIKLEFSPGPEAPIQLGFSPDGKYAFGAAPFGGAAVFNAHTGRVIKVFRTEQTFLGRALNGPDASSMFLIDQNNVLLTLRASNGFRRKRAGTLHGGFFIGEKDAIYDRHTRRLIGLEDDNRRCRVAIAYIGRRGQVERQTTSPDSFPSHEWHCGAFWNSERQLLLGQVNGIVDFVDISSGKLRRTLKIDDNPVVRLQFAEYGRRLLIASRDQGEHGTSKVTIWSLPALKLIRTIRP